MEAGSTSMLQSDLTAGRLSEPQAHALGVVNLLYAFYELVTGGTPAVQGAPPSNPVWTRPEVVDALRDAVQALRQLIQTTVEPFLQTAAEYLTTAVAAIHKDNFADEYAVDVEDWAVIFSQNNELTSWTRPSRLFV